MAKRALFFFMAVLCLLGGVLLRVYAISADDLSDAADEQASVTLTLGTARGTIYDRNLTPLVNTRSEWRAAVAPYPQAVSLLRKTLAPSALEDVLERLQGGKPIALKLEELLPTTDGIVTAEFPLRYGLRTIAPHVIGYCGADGSGVTGAEYVFDDLLSSYSGAVSVTYAVDAVGTPIEGVAPTVQNTLGNVAGGVVLTLDGNLQRMAEEVAKTHLERGAVLITEPQSGDILAMVSVPDYQPLSVEEALTEEGAPLLNRAMTDYNCGSVFKMVTVAAALEAGIPVSRSFTCSGNVEVDGVGFHCHNVFGHGVLDMTEGFSKSCNPYFIQLGQEVGAERLYDMASSLGFTRAVSVAEDWQTARALLPSIEELSSASALANLSFGQGGLMATPVHLAQLVGAIVNDGKLVRPRLVYGTVDADGTLREKETTPYQNAFSASTAAALRTMMEQSMIDGTGALGQPFHLAAAAKTGTAETGWYEEGKEVVQHWYAGYYPAENPQYVIVVLSENMEASGVRADPAFRQLCEELYARMLVSD